MTHPQNCTMSTDTPTTRKHELEEVIARLMTGKRDPEAARKACERMDRMREEFQKRVRIVDIAVPAIRELRDS